MKINKKLKLVVVLLIGIVLVSFFVGAASRASVQYTRPSSANYDYGKKVDLFPKFNDEMCEAGQDFLIQVAPFGCTPSVVRSDLLEEQNVPVFCQIAATKINPLIKVEGIDYITFSKKGYDSDLVSGVGFHPANAAFSYGRGKLINSPFLENIGYAVVVLKKQKNESAMPDLVEGTLTANIRYDVENAFGIGKGHYYLPEMEESEWERNYKRYGFWQGRGFLKLEDSDNGRVSVAVYADKDKKIASVNLKEGETSKDIYLPGFYCMAGLKLRLDDLDGSDTRVKLRINEDFVEVTKGGKFLNDDCSVRRLEKQGLAQKVDLSCSVDEGSDSFELILSPSIELKIDGDTDRYSVGDYLYKDENGRAVYLGFIGAKGNSEETNDLYIYPIASPKHRDKLSDEEIAEMARYDNYQRDSDARFGVVRVGSRIVKGLFSFSTWAGNFIFEGEQRSFSPLFYGEEDDYWGKKIEIVGFASAGDRSLKAEEKEYFDKAMEDYLKVIESFSTEKDPNNDLFVFGEEALYNAIQLANTMQQRKTMMELCDRFREMYPDSDKSLIDCDNVYRLSNIGEATHSVSMNGQIKIISFEGIYEPSFEEYGASIVVEKDGKRESYDLRKNEIQYLGGEFQGDIFVVEDRLFIEPGGMLKSRDLYFTFNSGEWKWSINELTWMRLSEVRVGGVGSGLHEGNDIFKGSLEFVNLLKPKLNDYEEGKNIILENGGKSGNADVGGSEYIQLVGLEQDYAEIKFNFKSETTLESVGKATFASNTRRLSEDVPEGLGSHYVLTVTDIYLEDVAKVSVLPNIKNAGTEANFSFKVGIEKRAIQLTPGQIKDRIDNLEGEIGKWEKVSDNLGNVVKGLKAGCLSMGTILTVKNFFGNLGGKSIARQEVMRSDGGWMDICEGEISNASNDKFYGRSLDYCLAEYNDEINQDVDAVYGVMKSQEPVTEENVEERLPEITKSINDTKIKEAFTKEGYESGAVSLSEAKDLERYEKILNSNPSDKLKRLVEEKKKELLGDIGVNVENAKKVIETKDTLNGLGLGGSSVRSLTDDKRIIGIYDEGILNDNHGDLKKGSRVQPIHYGRDIFLLELKEFGNNVYRITDVYEFDTGRRIPSNEKSLGEKIIEKFEVFKTSEGYNNKFDEGDKVVRYFETEPYKGRPAIVPFDTKNGWYVKMKQSLPVFGGLQTYGDSGQIMSFELCNVGKEGRVDGKDECRVFDLSKRQIYGEFSGLDVDETNKLVREAVRAVEDAQDAYKPGLKGKINIGGEPVSVGMPAADVPQVACQDFMSPKECLLLFNTCDPVICPSSRCDFGGTYPVSNVIQSGIVGSALLCLPNYKEKIVVPVCLTGVKAGIDGWISVYRNYRDCLQESLDTGQSVGVCDEIHSIYACEFFWRQGLPLAKMGLPKLLEVVTGQTGRGGGEYMGVANAWETAQKSVNYMTQYYGANSYQMFKARTTEEVGGAICKNFASGVYPSNGDFFDALLEPDSPSQFHAWFHEIPFSTTTVPATSQYKVFYHIYSGKDQGAYYNVYLRAPSGSSFYQDNPTVSVGSGYISAGDYATDTTDFTAPSGYQELCISVNGQEDCGFKQASTSFAVDYVTEKYVKEQAEQTDIKTEKECISGSPSFYGLVSPNIQEGVEEAVNPDIRARGIVRVCSTSNPGKATDANADGEGSRWIDVGYCGDENMRCWLDKESVKGVIHSTSLLNETLSKVEGDFYDAIMKSGNYIQDFDSEVKEIEKLDSAGKVSRINDDLIAKAFLSWQKAKLFFMRGNAYRDLAVAVWDVGTGKKPIDLSDKTMASGAPVDSLTYENAEGIKISNYMKVKDYRLIVDNKNYVSPVFEFKDGKLSANVKYKFENGGWNVFYRSIGEWQKVSDVLKDDSVEGGEIYLVEKLKDKIYSQGLNYLIEAPSTSPWYSISPSISTEKVEVGSDRIFVLEYETVESRVIVERPSISQKKDVQTVKDFYLKYSDNCGWQWSLDKDSWKSVTDSEGVSTNELKVLLELLCPEEVNFINGAMIIFEFNRWGVEGAEEIKVVDREVQDVLNVMGSREDCKCGDKCGEYAYSIVDSTREHGIPDPLLLLSVMIQESGCQNYPCKEDNSQISCGLMQVNEEDFTSRNENPIDSKTNIMGGARHLKMKYDLVKDKTLNCYSYSSNWEKAVHAYNGWVCSNTYYPKEVWQRYDELAGMVGGDVIFGFVPDVPESYCDESRECGEGISSQREEDGEGDYYEEDMEILDTDDSEEESVEEDETTTAEKVLTNLPLGSVVFEFEENNFLFPDLSYVFIQSKNKWYYSRNGDDWINSDNVDELWYISGDSRDLIRDLSNEGFNEGLESLIDLISFKEDNALIVFGNEKLSLGSVSLLRKSEDGGIFAVRVQSLKGVNSYVKNLNDDQWMWSYDSENWMSYTKRNVEGGDYDGWKINPDLDILVKSLQGKDFLEGAKFLFGVEELSQQSFVGGDVDDEGSDESEESESSREGNGEESDDGESDDGEEQIPEEELSSQCSLAFYKDNRIMEDREQVPFNINDDLVLKVENIEDCGDTRRVYVKITYGGQNKKKVLKSIRSDGNYKFDFSFEDKDGYISFEGGFGLVEAIVIEDSKDKVLVSFEFIESNDGDVYGVIERFD
ncbi:transglycosylase SLT domain-containing protein [Nanoarchaeota archaeon]